MAALVVSAGLALQARRTTDPHIRHDRFSLPGFDAYVYVAMAEHPSVFTLAPWGHRVLAPALAHALHTKPTAGYRRLGFAALLLAGVLLAAWLIRLGHRPLPVLLAAAAFVLSVPVREAVRTPFLCEPTAIALEVAFLLALTSGAPASVLGALLALGVMAKELLLVLVLLVPASRAAQGWRVAARDTVIVLVPALAVRLILTAWWAPVASASSPVGIGEIVEGARRILAAWPLWWQPALLGGVLPLAALGLLREAGRSYFLRHAPALLPLVALPFAAAVYGGSGRLVSFFADDVPRLLLYPLPLLLPLAVAAVDGVRSGVRDLQNPHTRPDPIRASTIGGWIATAVVVCALVLGVDSYRRLDLDGPRDGPYVLGFCRESWRTAERLERGAAVTFDATRQQYLWGETDPGQLDRLRWFLHRGFGSAAHYGSGPMVTQEAEATLVLPVLRPQPLLVTLLGSAPRPTRVRADVAGVAVGEADVGTEPREIVFAVGAGALVRGDNLLRLVAAPGLAIDSVRIAPAGAPERE